MAVFDRLHMPSLGGATEWLNSEPLGPAELRGQVVLVNFWTLTCINWLRQEPYVRAWSRAYRDDGLVVIGVHTPEFSFEHDIDGVRQATKDRAIDYPVADRQRLRDLGRLRQPLLACALLRRHGRRDSGPALRRGTLRRIRARHPAAARRRARTRRRRRARRRGRGRLGSTTHARHTSATDARTASPHRTVPRSRNATPTRSPSACASTTGPFPASGRSDARVSCSTRPAGASPSDSMRATLISGVSPRGQRADSLPRLPRRRASRPVSRRRRRRGRERPAPGRPHVPARARARPGPRADAGDHVPRAWC